MGLQNHMTLKRTKLLKQPNRIQKNVCFDESVVMISNKSHQYRMGFLYNLYFICETLFCALVRFINHNLLDCPNITNLQTPQLQQQYRRETPVEHRPDQPVGKAVSIV